jgi:malate dehydrogenase (oxaloacetate-decarboxylating)
MGIPIGKLALYTGCGGLHPVTTLPILLDVGTDNPDCLADPLYIGWRHERVRGQEYDDFVEAFVSAVVKRWPHVLLQWEDFAKNNATRLLERYRDRLCTFNDDVQGTAAVATGALLAAINVTGVPLTDQRVAVLGAGSAGCGIAGLIRAAMRDAGLPESEAAARFFMVDRDGLLVEGMTGLASFQLPFVQNKQAIEGWKLNHPDKIGLLDVVRNARPTVLIGVSGQAGAFSEPVVRAMAECNARPVIFPLSNPTSREEATPADIEAWTDRRALIGVGSPFPPITREGARFKVDQTNNSYIFPGVGLGALAVGANRVSDGMFMAAAKALASSSPARDNPKHNLLPPVGALREVAMTVALAVALQAHKEGLVTDVSTDQIEQRIRAKVWTPGYVPYRRATGAAR